MNRKAIDRGGEQPHHGMKRGPQIEIDSRDKQREQHDRKIDPGRLVHIEIHPAHMRAPLDRQRGHPPAALGPPEVEAREQGNGQHHSDDGDNRIPERRVSESRQQQRIVQCKHEADERARHGAAEAGRTDQSGPDDLGAIRIDEDVVKLKIHR